MASPKSVREFGNFLRTHIERNGGPSKFAKKSGLNVKNLERYCRALDSAELNIRPRNREQLAVCLGFTAWEEIEKGWRAQPLPKFDSGRRSLNSGSPVTSLGNRVLGLNDRDLIELLKMIGPGVTYALSTAGKTTVLADVIVESLNAIPHSQKRVIYTVLSALIGKQPGTDIRELTRLVEISQTADVKSAGKAGLTITPSKDAIRTTTMKIVRGPETRAASRRMAPNPLGRHLPPPPK